MAKFTLLLQHLGEIYNCCIWHFFPVNISTFNGYEKAMKL